MGNGDGSPRLDTSALPATIAPGSLLLVTGAVEPAERGLPLQVFQRYATPRDVGIVVTTTASAEETIEAYAPASDEDARPSISIVDTVSRGQNLTAFHRDVPTVFTPGPPDPARVSVAIANLTAQSPSAAARHLVVRSLTPFFEADPSAPVVHRLERTFGRRSDEGLVVLGVDFTAIDGPTMEALTGLADGVVRLATSETGQPTVAYRGTTPRHPPSRSETDGHDE